MNKHEWQDRAYFAAKKALRYFKGQPFMAEALLAAVLRYVDPPADARSWGGVIRRLKADRVIVLCGYGRAKTSRGSVKPKWLVP